MANRIAWPEALNISWSLSNATVNADAIEAPDGTLTADELVASNLGGTGVVRAQLSVSGLTASSGHYYAPFVKKGGVDWCLIAADALGIAASAYFNANTGVFGTLGANVDSASVLDYGNGWWRPVIQFTTGVDVSGLARIYPAGDDGVSAVPLDGVSSDYVSVGGTTVTPISGQSFASAINSDLVTDFTEDLARDFSFS